MNDQPFKPANLSNWVSRCFDKLGQEDQTSHSMRHTFASYQTKGEAKPSDVCMMLGHSSPGVTDSIYNHSWEARAVEFGQQHEQVLESLGVEDPTGTRQSSPEDSNAIALDQRKHGRDDAES